MKRISTLLAGAAVAFTPGAALSQQAPATPASVDAETASADAPDDSTADIIVTGVARGTNRLDSSVSTSAIGAATLTQLAPRNTAEVLKNLPGIRVEASGGEGNANISIRGLPVATGGSKFLQLQEDGLPVLEFGDISFGNADIFVRNDLSLARIESVRGGSASTFASNSPGGIINFLSKTGEQDGGSFQITEGLDYREHRVDFVHGGRIDSTTRYQISGFYRLGDGPRHVGYNAMRGGQIKANITKEFDGGYIRLYGKYLDDRGIGYLPNLVRVTGSNDNPQVSNLPGFSINNDTMQSRYIQQFTVLDGDNQPTVRNVGDGMRPTVKSVGLEGEFEIADGWKITERFRYSDIKADFVAPFPTGNYGDAQTVANRYGGAGAQMSYASGPLAGQAVSSPSTLGGNGLLVGTHLFSVSLPKLDNITNDIRITGSVPVGSGYLNLAAGFYKSRQYIVSNWLYSSFFQTLQGNGESVLIDVRTAAGVPITDSGVFGAAARFAGGGGGNRRGYDLRYDVNAPFAQVGLEIGGLNLDGSLRYDFGSARGTIRGGNLQGISAITSYDFNGDGLISNAESNTAYFANGSIAPVDYDYDYLSYSFGANYKLTGDLAVFARYSRGGRANADRLLFGTAVSTTTGDLLDKSAAVDNVTQAEGGLKYRSGPLALYATVFHANTRERNYFVTNNEFVDRRYKATGVELEGNVRAGPFSLTAGATYTDSKITFDAMNPALVGNRPRRQAKFIYQATPQVDIGEFATFGVNVVGTTGSYTQDVNLLKLPGYTVVNAFLTVRPADNVTATLNGNNLFNVIGLTEAEDATLPASGIIRARSINGRTISASVKFDF